MIRQFHKNGMHRAALFCLAASLLSLWGCSNTNSQGWEDYWLEHRFQVQGNQLIRGDSPFFLRTVEAPELLLAGTSYDEKVAFLNNLCARGGNSISVSVPSQQLAEGKLDSAWLGIFRGVTRETQYRNMGVVLRIPTTGTQADALEGWLKDLARLQADRWDVIYWFEGEGAERAVELIRQAAPKLVLAASDGAAQMKAVSREPSATATGGPLLLVGRIGLEGNRAGGFVLPAGTESLEQLETAYSDIRAPAFPGDQSQLSSQEKAEGFVSLFDGKSWAGWIVSGATDGWRIEGGSINWVTRGGADVRSSKRYEDFVLRLEWRVFEREANSGIFVRAPLGGRASRIGIEFQIFGDYGVVGHPTGTGSIYDVVAPLINASRPIGEWNSVEISCIGSHFQAILNGVVIHDLDLNANPVLKHRLRRGFIALQDHGHRVSFRNIRIRELQYGQTDFAE